MFTRVQNGVAGFFKQLKSIHSGQTLVEYALILALVTLAAIVALTALGGQLKNLFSKVSSMIT
jgi:pilus assembly protein Flp/PilA